MKAGCNEAHSLGKTFEIIAVTAHYYYQPEIIQDIPIEYHPHFSWINWQKIAFFINQTLEDNRQLSFVERLFTEDLYQLLIKKRLRNFEGRKVFENIPTLEQPPDEVFFEAVSASYRGDFLGFLHVFGDGKPIGFIPTDIFFYASTADFRGSFLGFDKVFYQFNPQTIPEAQIFISASKGRSRCFLSLMEQETLLETTNDKLFFAGV